YFSRTFLPASIASNVDDDHHEKPALHDDAHNDFFLCNAEGMIADAHATTCFTGIKKTPAGVFLSRSLKPEAISSLSPAYRNGP
ncbi:hypothetical protein, partial [Serratia marcescens]|uniref:hypothetical protein n=1 Tax=Serratia marcescens TaxID=615 RepID=UPI001D1833F3